MELLVAWTVPIEVPDDAEKPEVVAAVVAALEFMPTVHNDSTATVFNVFDAEDFDEIAISNVEVDLAPVFESERAKEKKDVPEVPSD